MEVLLLGSPGLPRCSLPVDRLKRPQVTLMAVRPGTGGQGREHGGNLEMVIRCPYQDGGDKRLVALCPPVPGKGLGLIGSLSHGRRCVFVQTQKVQAA